MSEKTVLDEIRERVERAYAQGFKDGISQSVAEFLENLKRHRSMIIDADFLSFDPLQDIEDMIDGYEQKLQNGG